MRGRGTLRVLSFTCVTSVGALKVIPPYVELGGTLRSLTTEGMQRLHQRLKELLIRNGSKESKRRRFKDQCLEYMQQVDI
ncbi:IAA-amino acid hydrolase ILR1-like protein 5 [Tanacetum coccineum]